MKRLTIESKMKPSGDQPRAIKALVDGIKKQHKHQTLLGVTGSGKTYTMANIIAQTNKTTLILAPNKTLAAQLYAEMREFFPRNSVEYFVSYYDYYQPEAYVPVSDTFIEKDASLNEHIEQMRLSATKSLTERKDAIVVGTVSAIYGLGDPETYFKMILHIVKGDIINQRDILRKLTELQYVRNDLELRRGSYQVKGQVIDIFPGDSEKHAVRVDLFGDEIENIFLFDPLTGDIVKQLNRTTIYPKTHYVTPQNIIDDAMIKIRKELKERIKFFSDNSKLIEEQRIRERTNYDLEMMKEMGYCSGIENYSRYLSGRGPGEPPPCLLDYMPKDGLVIIDESHVGVPQMGGMYRGDQSRKQTLVDYGFRLPSAMDNRPLKFDEFESYKFQTIYVSATPGPYELDKSQDIIEQLIRPTGLVDPVIDVRPSSSQVEDVLSEINKVIENGNRVLITTLTKKMSENLSEYLQEHNIKVKYLHSDIDTVERVEIIRDLRKGEFDVLVGINLLREGLDLPEVQLVAILDADKEGFLRSETSLIQTVGRAARNQEGYVIMYADKITDSMTFAINETERRRGIQQEHNRVNNITPKTIQKEITDILELVEKTRGSSNISISKSKLNLNDASKTDLIKLSKNIEKEMNLAADLLEFELAARLRDELKELKKEISNYSE